MPRPYFAAVLQLRGPLLALPTPPLPLAPLLSQSLLSAALAAAPTTTHRRRRQAARGEVRTSLLSAHRRAIDGCPASKQHVEETCKHVVCVLKLCPCSLSQKEALEAELQVLCGAQLQRRVGVLGYEVPVP